MALFRNKNFNSCKTIYMYKINVQNSHISYFYLGNPIKSYNGIWYGCYRNITPIPFSVAAIIHLVCKIFQPSNFNCFKTQVTHPFRFHIFFSTTPCDVWNHNWPYPLCVYSLCKSFVFLTNILSAVFTYFLTIHATGCILIAVNLNRFDTQSSKWRSNFWLVNKIRKLILRIALFRERAMRYLLFWRNFRAVGYANQT